MSDVQSSTPLPYVPSHLTVPQFILDDYAHISRPKRLDRTPCLIDDESGRTVFMHELRSRSQHLASTLYHRYNIRPDDIVAIMSPNHLDFGPCVWAAHRIGAIISTISPTLSSSELVVQLRLTEPSLLIVHPDCLPTVTAVASSIQLPLDRLIVFDTPESTGTHSKSPHRPLHDLIEEGCRGPPAVERFLAPDEAKSAIAFLAPSSGTTGIPKAVSLTHYNVISIIIQEATLNRLSERYAPHSEQRFRPGDVCGGFLPLYHIYGLVFNLHFMIYAGMTLVLAKKFHFESFLASIERYQITHLPLVPPQAVLLCKHQATRYYDLSCVRYCIVAAAPLSASLTEELLSIMPNVELGQAYGMTETCGAVSMFPISQKIGTLGSAGQLLPGTMARVVKDDGTLAREGEAGELYVKGGQVALGYYRNPIETSRTFIDGWLRTGDQVIFKDGDIFILERVKELIKVKALQVAPAELEGTLLTHTCIADAAVIGVPDEFSGELPMAHVVLKPDAALTLNDDPTFGRKLKADIYQHVAQSLSRHKRLDGGITFTSEIPRNASGKILRRILRERSRSQDVRRTTALVGRARL